MHRIDRQTMIFKLNTTAGKIEGSVERLFLLINGVGAVCLGNDSKTKLVDLMQLFP